MRRSLALFLAVAVVGLAGMAPGCNIFNEIGNAECAAAGDGGDGGGGGEGGAGGSGGAGGAPDQGAGGAVAASAAVGAGGAPGAGMGAGAGNSSDQGAGGDNSRSVPRAPRPIHRHHKGGIGTAVSAFCTDEGLPGVQYGPVWQPLTTTQLRWIAAQNNIGAGQTGIQQSRTIGIAFELWVLTTMGQADPPGPGRWTKPITSPQRALKNVSNGGLPKSVIPEFVGDQLFITNWNPNIYQQSVFYEVKAVNGPLLVSDNRWQIYGFLDALTRFPKVPPQTPPPPALIFTSTSNTIIGADVVAQATLWSVAVWQQKVYYDANSATPNNPNLRIMAAQCLNKPLYGPSWVFGSAVFPVSPLTSPTAPPSSVIVPGDPDPDSATVVGP
jgi:hypothetical protein